MRRIVSAYISRKWWYKWIRSLSWFSFRYYWFVWLSFISACVLLVYLIKKPIYQEECSTKVIEASIKEINLRLNKCCNCSSQQDSIIDDTQASPPSPPNTIQCDGKRNKSDNGGNVTPAPKYFEVGNKSGTIKLCYENGPIFPDNIIIKHNGQIIMQTGQVIGGKCIDIPYVYHSGDPTYVEVIVEPSSDIGTKWEYTLGCPN